MSNAATEKVIRDARDSLTNKLRAERARLRHVAQLLIAEVGADGPMDAEGAARKAVNTIVDLQDKLREAEMDRIELLERSD